MAMVTPPIEFVTKIRCILFLFYPSMLRYVGYMEFLLVILLMF